MKKLTWNPLVLLVLTQLPHLAFSGKKGENIIIVGGQGGHGGGHGGGMPLILITGGKKKKDETILIIFPQKPHHHHHFVPAYHDHHSNGYQHGEESYGGGGHEMPSYSGGRTESHTGSTDMYSTAPSGSIPFSVAYRPGSYHPRGQSFPPMPHGFSMSSSPGESAFGSNMGMMSGSSSSPIIYGPSGNDEESSYDFGGFSKRRLNRDSTNGGPTILQL
jgi:hypothetical protein